MVDPKIELYDSSGANKLIDYSFGSNAKGDSITGSFRIYNDKGGTLSSDTATNCKVLIKTLWKTFTGLAPIDDDWISVKSTSYGDTSYTTLSSGDRKSIGYASANDTIPSNEYATLDIKIDIPSDAIGKLYSIGLHIDYN